MFSFAYLRGTGSNFGSLLILSALEEVVEFANEKVFGSRQVTAG